MADETLDTESDAENLLLSAVMGDVKEPDAQDLDKQKLDDPQDLDAEDEQKADEDGEDEAKETKAETEAEPEEDYVEIDLGDGKVEKKPIAEIVKGYEEYTRIEAQKAQIIEQVEREATERATTQLKQIETVGTQTAYMIHAALQLLQAPKPPGTDMLDPASQSYNPEKYHLAFAQYQQAHGQHQQAVQLGQSLYAQAQQAAALAKEQHEQQELKKLLRVLPDWGDEAKLTKTITDAGSNYGFTPQELDGILTDHRQAIVLQDALAYRAMKAGAKDVKAKVEAKAPRLVRTKQEAKATSAKARDANGRFASDALGRLAKSNSDEDAVAYFTGLVKQGRI